MKQFFLYAVAFISLITAITIPLDAGFWWGMARGLAMAVFINILPYWLEARKDK